MNESSRYQALTDWQIAGLVILCIRFAQGWIFWAGGSRRFIYAPSKLDPHSTMWLANKLQSAMPGALLGTGQIIGYLLNNFWLLYLSLVLFSLIELVSGLGLIFGFFTRFCAFLTAIINVILMLNFGWQGGTCLDEWTTAVSGFAMALTLMLSGAPIYSVDSWLLRRYPHLRQREAFKFLASGELTNRFLKNSAIILWIITILFTTATYNYFRGAIFSHYRPGPVSPTSFQYNLSNGQIDDQGNLQFQVYVSGGTTSVPSHIMRIELQTINGIAQVWTAKELSALPPQNIVNSYPYNKIAPGPYGLAAPVSAKATIFLHINGEPKDLYTLLLYTIDGKRWPLIIHNV